MAHSKLLPLAAVLAVLAGHGGAAPACTPCQGAGDVLDPSGICLPARVEGLASLPFSAAQRSALQADRNTVVAGYRGPRYALTVLVFVYQRAPEADDNQELQVALAGVLAANPGSRLEAVRKNLLHVAGSPTEAIGAQFGWQADGVQHLSMLWLVPHQDRYLKLRASYRKPAVDADEALNSVLDAVESIAKQICVTR